MSSPYTFLTRLYKGDFPALNLPHILEVKATKVQCITELLHKTWSDKAVPQQQTISPWIATGSQSDHYGI